MGTKYSDQSGSASAYNSSPPPDDGSQVAANKVTWATHKTKIGDPLKAYSDAMNTLLQTTLDFSSTQQTTNYNTQASDHMTTIEIPSGSPTISLGTAATMTKNYVVTVTNIGTGTPVIALQTNTDTLDGTVNGTFTFPTGVPFSKTFKVNNGATGYYTEKVGFLPAFGTWTPGISFGGGTTGITYSGQVGLYIRMSSLIIAWFQLGLSSKGSSTGSSVLTGLPFTVNSSTSQTGAGSISFWVNMTTTMVSMSVSGLPGTTTAQINGLASAAASYAQRSNSDFANNTTLDGMIVYSV